MLGQLDRQSGLPPAAAHPSNDELFRLGLRYSTGQDGDRVDFVLAHTCFNLAALHGSVEAMIYRKELGAEMNPSDVAEAQRVAREWMAQAAH
ncbi:MAG TPA: sel1 repeat family protein [Caulobacteraceae bacterium]|nr:sel1 repeat family protein [Caulobacteraceae bacterium]